MYTAEFHNGLVDMLSQLDYARRRIFFFCLEYVLDGAVRGTPLPTMSMLRQLTRDTELALMILRFVQAIGGGPLSQQFYAAMAALKYTFLPLPPSQTESGRVSTARAGVRMVDKPLGGSQLLDGQADTWEDRLKDKTERYAGGAGPLIANQFEARELRAEYASLHFKEPAGERADESARPFPETIEEQRQLVGRLYDAIRSMDDILETKRPISLKRRRAGEDGTPDTDDEGEDGDRPPRLPPKETISVRKVKSLSRIEVEMLCWDVLFTVRDIHRGRLPFMPWSRNDWCWEGAFGSFGQRFDAVVETLRQSKAAVCSLLESDKMARLAAHPRREYKRKENNRSQNAERNAQVFVGRHAIETQQVQVDASTGNLQDRDGNVVAVAAEDRSGLIEQTAKLADPGRREAKRVRFQATSPKRRQPRVKVQEESAHEMAGIPAAAATAAVAVAATEAPTTETDTTAAANTCSGVTLTPEAGSPQPMMYEELPAWCTRPPSAGLFFNADSGICFYDTSSGSTLPLQVGAAA